MTTEALARSLIREYRQDIGEALTALKNAKQGCLPAPEQQKVIRNNLGWAVKKVAQLKREHPSIHGPRATQTRLPL